MFVNSIGYNNINRVQNSKTTSAPLKRASSSILKDTVCFKGNEEIQKQAELLNRLKNSATRCCEYTQKDLEIIGQKIKDEPSCAKVIEYILEDGRDKSGKVRIDGGYAIKIIDAATPENIDVLPVLLNARNSKGYVLLNSTEVANIFKSINENSKEFLHFLLDAKNAKYEKRFTTIEVAKILKNINKENAKMVEGVVSFKDKDNEGEYLLNSPDEIIGALKILPEITRMHKG